MADRTIAVNVGGGTETQLYSLIANGSKPAVPIIEKDCIIEKAIIVKNA